MHHTTSPLLTLSIVIGTLVVVFIVIALIGRRKGYSGLGGETIVRCREGHLFTTIWIPGGSLKAVRLGWARLQRCPIDNHWTLVVPVKPSELTDAERRFAAEHRDSRIP
jgi:hypothetical protein